MNKLSDNTIYISAQIGNDPLLGNLIPSDIEIETLQLMKNLRSELEVVDCNFENVIKASISLSSLKNLTIVNEIYATYANGHFPAYEVIEASALPSNANVQIALIASK